MDLYDIVCQKLWKILIISAPILFQAGCTSENLSNKIDELKLHCGVNSVAEFGAYVKVLDMNGQDLSEESIRAVQVFYEKEDGTRTPLKITERSCVKVEGATGLLVVGAPGLGQSGVWPLMGKVTIATILHDECQGLNKIFFKDVSC